MIIKVKYVIFVLVLVNLMTVSCQSKSEDINLSILNEPIKSVVGSRFSAQSCSFARKLHSR